MSAQEFGVGERIRVVYDSARVEAVADVGLMHVSIGNWHTVVNLRNSGVTIERIGPAGWPPQAGDIWADKDGDEWVTLEDSGVVSIVLVDGPTWNREPDEFHKDYAPVRLIRRRDCEDLHDGMHPQPGDQPSAPVPNGVDAWEPVLNAQDWRAGDVPMIGPDGRIGRRPFGVDPDMRTAEPDRQVTP